MIASKDRHATAAVRRRASRGGILATQVLFFAQKHHGGGRELEYVIVGEANAVKESAGRRQEAITKFNTKWQWSR
jgi:hypothetical protein